MKRRKILQRTIPNLNDPDREQLGQELHDDLCQQLAGIEFLARALERRLEKRGEPESAQAGELARMTRRAMERTRQLARGLLLPQIGRQGLAAALEGLAEQTRAVFETDCLFRCDSKPEFPDSLTEVQLFRIAQQAVRNAIEHGKAGRIDIRLQSGAQTTILSVRDNGNGLPKRRHGCAGLGFRIMNRRARIMGGSLGARPSRGGGTLIICSVPRAVFHNSF